MLELVIFDADGVLFDSTESNTAYYNAIFAAIGEPPMNPAEEQAGVFMAAAQVFAIRAAGAEDKVARMREIARTMDSSRFFTLLRPPPRLREILLDLKRSYRLGLATNRSATIPAIVDYLGLEGLFDAIASARDPVRPKPAPDILALCLERARVKPGRAVYVGDSDTDRIAALAAGTHFVGLGERAPHHHWIAALDELPRKLGQIFGSRQAE
ncbi:MAG TPA: HAD family hydrolase [Candidatus Binataceae bacterium]|nr:HAD family hydrolase [Candidatus Binataceae bacterium]